MADGCWAGNRLGRWLTAAGAGRQDAEADAVPHRLPPPLHLAYLGDAVWELHVRTRLVASHGEKLADIHRRAVDQVQAAAQASRLRQIAAQLTEDERDMVRRGRNASPQGPRSAAAADYRYSTGFECLLGYLYWTGQVARLKELLERMSGEG